MLAGLAACTTAPQQPSTPVVSTTGSNGTTNAASAASSTYSLSLPASPGLSVTPLEAPTTEPVDASGSERPRPALLAGESAREYQRGGASWYGPGFHGRRTASGERYDMNAMTAAHRTLPFGTWVRVHSLVNGREVDVRITDRGPFISSRVIDLSRGAAVALGMLGMGFKEVVLSVPDTSPSATPSVVPKSLPSARGRRLSRKDSPVR